MKIFFSILILYLLGSFLISILISTNRIRLINQDNDSEVKMDFFLKLAFILYWPLTIWLILKNFKKED